MYLWHPEGVLRIPKVGIALHGIEASDKVLLICCALLEEDELDDVWNPDDFRQSGGNHNPEDMQRIMDTDRVLTQNQMNSMLCIEAAGTRL